MLRIVTAVAVLVASCVALAHAQDVAGGEDHPIVSRYPGSVIRWYHVDNFRPYTLPVGPVTGYRAVDEVVETEGRVTRIYYTLDGGARSADEVYRNYRDALAQAGFEILAEGFEPAGSRSAGVGSRKWREVLFITNPWNEASAAVNEMTSGSSTSGGGGAVIGRKQRAENTAYVVVSVYQFRADRVGTLVDVVEVAAAETGLVVVDAEAIGAAIDESGRVVLDGILFDFDTATLKPESRPAFDEIAAYLASAPGKSFYVVGHTDSRGAFAYNHGLSSERARAVVDELVTRYGIARDRLEPHGVGPLAPVFTNASDAGRERNRRVELVER